MVEKPLDKYFRSYANTDKSEIWSRFCGFFDLSLEEFMQIQEHLLMDQIQMVSDSLLGKEIMKAQKPASIDEFRQLVPLTTYSNYATYLDNHQEEVLAMSPIYWIHTSGRGGSFKWAPRSVRSDEMECRSVVGICILSSASKKGEVNVHPGVKVLTNLPPRPYVSGFLLSSMNNQISFEAIPPLEESDKMDFQERILKGFEISLRTGVDYIASMASILNRIGEGFTEQSNSMSFALYMLHPLVLFRLIKAWISSKIQKRRILPKDLWRAKGIISYGTDLTIYKSKIEEYWGNTPCELYAASETGTIAMQNWNKKWMTFLPDMVFLEFIPEEEWQRNRDDENYQPSTLLLNQVIPGEKYELVVTNFHGMPFLRYRIGDLIKIVALEDEESGIKLPQMVFYSRADDLIDIAGFTRLDEKSVWQAIHKCGIEYVDWVARKELEGDNPVLRIYIELKEGREIKTMEDSIHQQLKILDRDFRDLDNMLNIHPVRVTTLSNGTFNRYLLEKQRQGADLARLKPPHMNPSESVIELLLELDKG
jgi:hypothetical protein